MKLLPISMLLAAQYCDHLAEAFAGKRHHFIRSSARHYREDAMLPIGGDDSSKGVEEDEPSILLSSPSLKEEVTPMKLPARSSSWKAIVERSQQQPPRNDFQSRMKRIVVQQKQQKRTSYRPSNIKNIVSLNDFAKVIEEGRRESKVVVVNFIATWCKTCHSLRPHFDKAASSNPDIIFLEVPVLESNSNLHQGLGVESVPFGHVYHPTRGLVEETSLSRKTFGEFVSLVEDMHSSSSS